MKEICIPLLFKRENENIEIEVKTRISGDIQRYRVESVQFGSDDIGNKNTQNDIDNLKQYIDNYNQNWELISIFDINPRNGNIHMLYREKIISLTMK
jgi:hypothetical protein